MWGVALQSYLVVEGTVSMSDGTQQLQQFEYAEYGAREVINGGREAVAVAVAV